MRQIPAAMAALWNGGGPFIGTNGAAHGRVTVEKNWTLSATSGVNADVSKLPYRWWQRADNSQVETEVPNIKSIQIDRSLDADAQTCTIVMYNTTMNRNSVRGVAGQLGQPGAYTWNYGERDAAARWGQSASAWNNVLIPNALLRTYQGYGGRSKTIGQALTDGNILLTGVWLIDEVRVGTDGMLNIKCRDMAKLLLDQQLFPPFMPATRYPLHYYRWKFNKLSYPAVLNYDESNPVDFGPGSEGPKFISDISISADGLGYYVTGTDGGVFAFDVPFYGGRGTDTDNAPMTGMAVDPLNHGYWLVAQDGGVFAFGQVGFYGSAVGIPTGTIEDIAAAPDGRGYWLVDVHGAVYAYGSATYFGGQPVNAGPIIGMEATATGRGYWLLSAQGGVYAYGDATYYGGVNTSVSLGLNIACAIVRTPSGNGYYIAVLDGTVYPFGAARVQAPNGTFNSSILGDPITGMSVTPTGNGYVLVAGNGGVYAFGDAPFFGSLLAPFSYTQKLDGDYLDYVDIIKDLVLWSGWLLYDGSNVEVYGTLESTGAYSEDEIDPSLFDKRPVIDSINGIKEIVGYYVWIDEEGGFHFESPNWYQYGNILDVTSQRVESLYVIDEQYQLTDYLVSYTDSNVRSEIIIASSDPTAGLTDTVTTRQTVTSDLLRGMIKPAMVINGFLTKPSEQERMLESLLDHINFSLRQGTVTCVANPAIQINDQVRIYERQTGETFVHYVKGIQSNMDLDTGEFTTVLTTFWLGEDWIIPGQFALPTAPGETGTIPGVAALPGTNPQQPPTQPPSTQPPVITPPTPPPTTGTGTRIAGLWPFAALGPSNLSMGSGALFELAGAAKTANLLSAGGGTVNAGLFSHPIYFATSSDPITLIDATGQNGNTISVHIPLTAIPAAGSDRHMHVIQPDGHTLVEIFNAIRIGSGLGSHFTGSPTTTDLTGPGWAVGGGGTRAWGGSAIYGLIRDAELRAAATDRFAIPHQIAVAVGAGVLQQHTYVGSDGLTHKGVWPAIDEDSDASTSYSGLNPMGTLLGIPPSVNVAGLGLSAEGLALATACQDFGVLIVDRSSGGTFYAEPSLESYVGLTRLRNDGPTIWGQLRVVTNNTEANAGGPGTRRRDLAPALA